MSNISTTGPGINEASNPYVDLQSIRTAGYVSTTTGITGTFTLGGVNSIYYTPPWQIVSMSLEDGKLVVIKKQESGVTLTLAYYPYGQPSTIVKEIYAVQGNEIVLEQTVYGRHVPPVSTEGHYEFDENA